MSLEECQRWCEALHLPAETVDLIARSRFSPPARRTQERAGNVSGISPSRKMGVTIQFESQIELGAIYLMEYDAGVVECYDQPAPAFKLSYQTRSGRQAAPFHTPDLFVLRTDQAGWEEWKPEDQLRKRASKRPFRYQQRDGQWVCPPGAAYAARFGHTSRVHGKNAGKLQRSHRDFLAFSSDSGRRAQTRENKGLLLAVDTIRARETWEAVV